MNETYENYKKFTNKLINGNHESYMRAVNDGFVVERLVNMNGEPYRFLTEVEWNYKFKPKN